MKLGETTPVKDVLGLPQTSQCELLSTLLSSNHNDPQQTSTTNLNHEPWAVSSYYKNERTIAFTGGKLHYTALTTTNEPVRLFHHNPIIISSSASASWSRNETTQCCSSSFIPTILRMQGHHYYYFLIFMLHCKLFLYTYIYQFCIHTSIFNSYSRKKKNKVNK